MIIGVASFLMAIISGIGGGGGGFITTPLLIFLGLTPQQAVASGKIGGLGTTFGSLHGLTKAKVHKWKAVVLLMVLSTAVGLVAPHIITRIDNQIYRLTLGILLILLIPVVIFGQVGVKARRPAQWQKIVALPTLTATLLLQAIFSGGMGTLVVLTLMGLLGMPALEANVTKRFSQITMNILIVLGLAGSGLILWRVASVLFISGSLGGYVGSQIAIKKGDRFITYVFAILMFVSGLELIFGQG